MRPRHIRPAGGLSLQEPQIDAKLQDLSAVSGLHHSHLGNANVEIPALKRVIDVLMHG